VGYFILVLSFIVFAFYYQRLQAFFFKTAILMEALIQDIPERMGV
jgi:high-affinity Fe2+/Pb2+ permease